jgi:solute carrier family 25 phosphate transporter 3
MIKFAAFERIVMFAFWLLHSTGVVVGRPPGVVMTVTVLSGCTAGAICAIVSHPADTLVSRLAARPQIGWRILLHLPIHELYRGVGLRVAIASGLTAMQWMCYNGFKLIVGLPTTG